MSTFSKIAQGLRLTGVSGATNDMVGNWLKGLGLAGATPDMLFTYLRSTGLTGSLSDMLSAYVFSSGVVLIDLSPTSNGFYSLGTDFVASGDFEAEVDFVTTSTSFAFIISGGASATDLEIAVTSSGGIQIFYSASSRIEVGSGYNDGKLHELKLVRSGTSVSVDVDGTNILNITISGDATFADIGRRGGSGFYFNGIISNVKLTDIATPANSLEFKLDQLTANTETNNGVTLTYQNIGTGTSVRNTYVLSNGGTQYISDLRTIDIAAQA